jgi:hypothetical protein
MSESTMLHHGFLPVVIVVAIALCGLGTLAFGVFAERVHRARENAKP